MRCAFIAAAVLAVAGSARAADAPAPPAGVPTMFSAPLPDVPGKHLVVVHLTLPRAGGPAHPHRHPGSVYVYVIQGTARLGVEGQPVQIVHAGESFFEPVGALHTVAESASPTETASAIAVMIVPDGAPLVMAPGAHAGH